MPYGRICLIRGFFSPEGGVGLVPKRGCLLTLAYYVFPRWYEFGERWWNGILTGKTEELGEKPVPVPLCPPQIPHGFTRARARASATNNLSHGTAQVEAYVTHEEPVLQTLCVRPNIFLRTWCSNICSQLSSLDTRDNVWDPYKTTRNYVLH
jgi:hypothetical protein